MRWRADLLAMLRARWLVLAAWTVALAAAATAMLAYGWWAPPSPTGVEVELVGSVAAKEMQAIVEEHDDEYDIDLDEEADPDEEVDTGETSPTLAALMDEDTCAPKTPFQVDLPAGERWQSDFVLEVVAARHATALDGGAYFEPKTAPEGSAYVELVVTARNEDDETDYPSRYFGIVTREGKLYVEVFETLEDRLGGAAPDEKVAGVVAFRVPVAVASAGGPLTVVMAHSLFSADDAASAIASGRCGRVTAATASSVGDSPLVENHRLVRDAGARP